MPRFPLQVLEVSYVESLLKLQLEYIANFQIPPSKWWWRKNLNFKEILVFFLEILVKYEVL